MGLAIVLFFVVHAIEKHRTGTGRLPFVAQLDNIIYDSRLRLTMRAASTRASSSSTSTRRAWARSGAGPGAAA